MKKIFAVITSAKNEEDYIEETIRSLVRQTLHPQVWCIIDDGSIDQTAEIIRDYAASHSFIQLISKEHNSKRSFGAKWIAVNQAYETVRKSNIDFIGFQDADIALHSSEYFERLLAAFNHNLRLGITGGYIFERKGQLWLPRIANSPDAVAGGIQMFRRDCFDQIGGYSPLTLGGSDWLAQIEAKRLGWEVAAMPELAAHHYRPTSSADGRIKGLFRLGMMDASFGSDPVFEVCKCARRFREHPLIVGSLIRFTGYMWWRISRHSTLLTKESSAYLRREQRNKLHSYFFRASKEKS